MAKVTITIQDIGNGIGIDITAVPLLPESAILYTNAQMVSNDIINMIQVYAKQINTKAQQDNVTQTIEANL